MNKFTLCEFQLIKGDQIFMFSDGYQDQFGGEFNKKFLRKRFIDILLEVKQYDSKKQKEILKKTLDEWQGERDQIDDITIFGLTI